MPPSLRNRGPGERMPGGPGGGGNRDDMPTLRVTNISEDVEENDLRDLFGVFGRVARVYVGRDRETGAGKGFAFVSFEDREVAKKAMEKLHGRGYDNLILSVQWSRMCPQFSWLGIYLTLIFRAEGAEVIVSFVALFTMMLLCTRLIAMHMYQKISSRKYISSKGKFTLTAISVIISTSPSA